MRSKLLSCTKNFLAALVLAVILLPGLAAQAATVTYDLGVQDSGTTIPAGIDGLITWIEKGSLPTGSILDSVSVNARLDYAPIDNWASDICFYVDPAPENPGTNALLQVGGYSPIGNVAAKLDWGDGDDGQGTTVNVTKYAGTDFSDTIDLGTARLSIGNGYADAPIWSGSISFTYHVFTPATADFTWRGADTIDPLQWSTSGSVLNWSDGSGTVAYANGKSVLFDDSVGSGSTTVDISVDNVLPSSVLFDNTKTYTLTGSKSITGDTGLTKQGSGLLIIQNANTYTGLTKISAGTLQIGNTNALPHGTAGMNGVQVGGTLDLAGFSPTLNGLTGGGIVTNSLSGGTATLTLGDADTSSTFSGKLQDGSGVLALIKTGNGSLKIDGLVPNTYSGGTIVSGGLLHCGTMVGGISPDLSGVLGTGPVTLDSSATIEFDRVTTANALISNGGKIASVNGWGFNWSGPITLNADTTVDTINGNAGTANLSGVVSGGGGLVTVGHSSVVLSRNNSYTGKTSVKGGTLAYSLPLSNIGVDGPLGAPTGDNALIDLYAGTRLQYIGGQGPDRYTPYVVTDRPLNLAGNGSGTVYLNGSNTNDTWFQFNGPITGTGTGARTLQIDARGDSPTYVYAGSISDMSDASKVSLSAVYSSGSSRCDGHIWLNGASSFSGPITLTGGDKFGPGVLYIGGTGSLGYDVGTGSSNYAGNINFVTTNSVAKNTVLNYASSANQILSGQISGDGNLTQSGPGLLTLTGSNTYTGDTTVSAGTLAIGAGGSISKTPTISLANGTTLDVTQATDYHLAVGQTLTGNTNFSVLGKMTVDSGATVRPGGPTNIGTLSVGALTLEPGSITNFKINGGNLDLVHVTSTDGLVINGGGVGLYQAGAPFAAIGTYDLFQYNGTDPIASNLSVLDQLAGFRYSFSKDVNGGNNYVAVVIGSGPVWSGGANPDSDWSNAANWTNGPIVAGDRLIFDGNTQVSNLNNSGIAQFSSLVFNPTAGNLGTGFTLNGSAVTLSGDSDGYLVYNQSPSVTHTINLPITVSGAGKSITTSDPTGTTVLNGAIDNGGNSVIFSGSGNTTIGPAGGISGNGGLTKNGPGTLAINAATTYKGDTLVVAGALSVGHSLALQNSTLDTSGSGTVNLNVLAATLGGIKGNGNLTIPSGGTLSVGNNDASTAYSGSLGGNGGLTKTGSGTLTVTATQGYTGATAITGNGTLKLQGALTSPPVPGYTYHFDAAYLGMTDGTPVTQWNNGGSVVGNAVVPSANQNVPPTYLADAGTGTHLGALAFAGNGGAASSSALQFPEDSSIRTLFSIFKGSSFLMTDIASGSYNFHRNGANIDGDPADPLWEGPSGSGWTSDNITSGTTSVNGVVADWSQTNMPINLHNGYNLVALQTTDNVQADSFNCDRGDTHAGDQSQAEVIIYDRPLTPTEMSQVSAYLNSKWFIGGGGSNLLPTGTALSIDLGSTLDLNGASQQIGLLTGSGTVTNTGGADATLTFSSGTSSIFGGVISDGPTNKTALTVSGGTLTLAGVNTFSGTTSVTGGMLAAGTLGALSASSDVTITGGTLSTRAFAQTVNSLTVGAEGTLNLYIGHLLTATNLSSLDGTLTLSGIANGRVELMNFPNGYTGTFANPSGYTLVYLTNEIDVIGGASHWKLAQSGNWSATGNWQGSVPSGNGAQAAIDPPTGGSNYTITLDGAKTVGTLEFGNSNSTTSGYTLSGTDTLTLNNSGTATITVTNGKHGIAVPVVLENDLAVSGSGTLTFSSSISGIGKSLTLNGPGTLILSGTGLYTGGTIVNAGTLAVTSSTALPDNQSLTVGAGGTLIFDPSYVASSIIATPISAASYAVSPVPEPSTLALLAAGLAVGFGAWRRKKK